MVSKSTKMVSGYRIVAARWANDAFSGEGARKFGGRWNSPGRRMVYLGGSRSLSTLEMLVHLTTPTSRTKPYCMIETRVPSSLVSTYPANALPDGWRTHPPGKLTMGIGDDWLQAGSQLALAIPSTIIPEEHNLLINPDHKDFKRLEIGEPEEFYLDQRLFA